MFNIPYVTSAISIYSANITINQIWSENNIKMPQVSHIL